MSTLETAALLAALTGLPDSAETYDAVVPNKPPLPYRVLYTDDGLESTDNLARLRGGPVLVRFQVTSVGANRLAAQVAAKNGHDALIGRRLQVEGRDCTPIRQITARPIERDDDVDPPVFYCASQYEFVSAPKSGS